jgi:hypothetical protein
MPDPRRPDLPDERVGDPGEHRRRLNEGLRAAYIEGAEADSVRRLGRGLTSEELDAVLRRYQARHRE